MKKAVTSVAKNFNDARCTMHDARATKSCKNH